MDNLSELETALLARRAPALADLGGGLLLGPGRAANDEGLLSDRGVTHILNVADDVPRGSSDKYSYCCLGVGDFGVDPGIARVFEKALRFVQPAIDGDGIVLVHCANGSNRSPTVSIALLMMLHDWSLATAWEHVSTRRSIQPLADNRRALLAFELTRGIASMVEERGTLIPLATEHAPSDSGDYEAADSPTASGASIAAGISIPATGEDKTNSAIAHAAAAPVADVSAPSFAVGLEESGQVTCDRCDGAHATDTCPHFSKARDKPPAAGEVHVSNLS